MHFVVLFLSVFYQKPTGQWMFFLFFQNSKKIVLLFYSLSLLFCVWSYFNALLCCFAIWLTILYYLLILFLAFFVFNWHFVLISIWLIPWCVVFVCPGLEARRSCLDFYSRTCRGTSWFECEYFVSYCVIFCIMCNGCYLMNIEKRIV